MPGLRAGGTLVPMDLKNELVGRGRDLDDAAWAAYRARVEEIAASFR